MDALNKAIAEVYFNIPMEILNLGFNDNPAYASQSIDETMLSRVIRPRVLVDCNLVGGIEISIPVSACIVTTYTGDYYNEYVIDVPKNITNNKSIITPLGLFSNTRARISNSQMGGTIVPALMAQVNAAAVPENVISTSRLELVGENRVLVAIPAGGYITGILKCVVENNANLSNINPRSYLAFSKLVVLAIKAQIYNYLIVKLGKGYIHNGHELGIVNDIISEYSTANEDYNLYLTDTWGKVAYHNDETRLTNFISGML